MNLDDADHVTIAEVVATVVPPGPEQAILINALLAREEHLAQDLMVIGTQFDLFPQIVAEAIAAVGLGFPKSEDERALIHENFVNLINHLRNAN